MRIWCDAEGLLTAHRTGLDDSWILHGADFRLAVVAEFKQLYYCWMVVMARSTILAQVAQQVLRFLLRKAVRYFVLLTPYWSTHTGIPCSCTTVVLWQWEVSPGG